MMQLWSSMNEIVSFLNYVCNPLVITYKARLYPHRFGGNVDYIHTLFRRNE